jgi:SulP family sulfate permease
MQPSKYMSESAAKPSFALQQKLERWHEFVPKSILLLKNYNLKTFSSDAIAGVTVGLVALPLAMAFAISSGVLPQNGLYCAIVAGFICAALGGSSTQVSGPTGAFVVVVAGIVAAHGIDGLFMCTLIAGVMLLLMAVTGLGSAVKFIPRPVVVGFTNGIAVLIASTQIKDFFGLKINKVPGDFLGRMEAIARAWNTISPAELTIGLSALAIIIVFMRFVKRVPGYIVALFAGTAVVALMDLPVATIGTRFGGIPAGLPHLQIPQFRPDLIKPLISPALTVAMLGAIESLMSAVVSDRMSGDKHNPNMELFGQGVANVISPLFGGLPATGAIARTATNVRSGAKTPVSAMIHSLTLLGILLFAAPLARNVPMAVLAAILFVVSYNMGEWKEIPSLLRLSRLEIGTWALTFALTVFADLTVAVEVGMVLAALIFIRNVTTTTTISEVTDEYLEDGRVHILQDKEIPNYVRIFRIHGPFLFGATEKADDIIARIPELPPVVVLRLRNMTAVDATGLHALEHVAESVQASGRALIFCGAPSQPRAMMLRAEFAEKVGKENICANVTEAIERAKAVYPSVQHAGDGSWKRRRSDRTASDSTPTEDFATRV